MPKYVVSGASGFIGSHIVKFLLETRPHVTLRALVRDAENDEKTAHLRALAKDCPERLTLYSAVLGDVEAYRKALNGADALLHVAR